MEEGSRITISPQPTEVCHRVVQSDLRLLVREAIEYDLSARCAAGDCDWAGDFAVVSDAPRIHCQLDQSPETASSRLYGSLSAHDGLCR